MGGHVLPNSQDMGFVHKTVFPLSIIYVFSFAQGGQNLPGIAFIYFESTIMV